MKPAGKMSEHEIGQPAEFAPLKSASPYVAGEFYPLLPAVPCTFERFHWRLERRQGIGVPWQRARKRFDHHHKRGCSEERLGEERLGVGASVYGLGGRGSARPVPDDQSTQWVTPSFAWVGPN